MSIHAASQARSSIQVIHLVFKQFGLEPFREFIESYRRHPAGLPHEFLVALKGFEDREEAINAYADELSGLPHRLMQVPDRGFDIGSYRWLAQRSGANTLCFLHSRSIILGDDWLLKLARAFEAPSVGMVGPTGSWESIASDGLREPFLERDAPWIRPLRLWGYRLRRQARYLRTLRHYPPFPNPHLRTNGILVERDRFLSLVLREPRTKEQAMRIESGWRGLTRQLLARGEQVRLVARDGSIHDIPDWADSRTFWQTEQELLLVGDNQTRRYADGSDSERARLNISAWHPLGRKAPQKAG
jgi:hypothetical protein